jgi:serine/threonine-protein kinase PRP4
LFVIPGKPESLSPSPTQAAFALTKEGDEEDAQVKVQAENAGAEQVSAADYDPSLDRREDEQKRVREPMPEIEVIEEEEEDDVDDMFAVATGVKKKVKKVRTVVSGIWICCDMCIRLTSLCRNPLLLP